MQDDMLGAQFFTTVWANFQLAGGAYPPIERHRHFSKAYEAPELTKLPLLLGGRDVRETQRSTPRTSLFPDAHERIAWLGHATAMLAEAAHAESVTADLHALSGNDPLLPKADPFDTVIVQLTGILTYWTGNAMHEHKAPEQHAVCAPGDILVVPRKLPYAATPLAGKATLHLSIAVHRPAVDTR